MRLVIMEDSSSERRRAIAMAEAAGHEVVVAAEGWGGCLFVTFAWRGYEGIITDLTVPDLRDPRGDLAELGYEVIEAAVQVRTPVVVCSGMRESYPDTLQPLVDANHHLIDWVGGYTPDQEYKRWDDAVAALERLVEGVTRA